MVPPGDYTVRDTWFTAGMRGTGSNTIVTDNVFVPETRMLRLADLRQGKGPGRCAARRSRSSACRSSSMRRSPLPRRCSGAAQGAYAHFREWTKPRKAVDGSAVAEKISVQVQMARAAADLDAAELLLLRTTQVPTRRRKPHRRPCWRARSAISRGCRRCRSPPIDTLMTLSGTAGFASSQPIQRAWRDIHFASTHIGVNPEINYGAFRPHRVRPAARSEPAVLLTTLAVE